jgi:hypothetical protein
MHFANIEDMKQISKVSMIFKEQGMAEKNVLD